LTKLGHEVILFNARFVKNYVVGNKTDFNDAEAIHEAATRPNKRAVAIKTVAQQDIQLVPSQLNFFTALSLFYSDISPLVLTTSQIREIISQA
jgi:hypothetical protein